MKNVEMMRAGKEQTAGKFDSDLVLLHETDIHAHV